MTLLLLRNKGLAQRVGGLEAYEVQWPQHVDVHGMGVMVIVDGKPASDELFLS